MTASLAAPAAAAPKRVVALTPFTANTAVAMGVRPVAIGQALGGKDRIDRRLRGVKVLPLSHPNGPNLEQLAALRPDLGASRHHLAQGLDRMKRLKIRVVESDPTSVAGVLSHMCDGRIGPRARQ